MISTSRSGALLVLLLMGLIPLSASGAQPPPSEPPADEADLEVRESVAVQPTATDADITARLTRVLEASGWFQSPQVNVEEGIVFLSGRATTEEHKEWAARLARNTQDVLAVVNHIDVAERSIWDLSPTWDRLTQLARDAIRGVPLILVGLAMLAATWIVARWSVTGASSILRRRIRSTLLAEVIARAVALPVFILGLYVVLSVSGLTGLALSVVGGTGLIGLVIGFAFRDIAENFLASLLISMQRPFATGDLITVAGHTGIVQRVNTRATLLMTLEGNHVQIPNATIYKQIITNFTANPNQRFDFTVGIGYEDSIARAQTVARTVLHEHPAVLEEPEPLVLVEGLGSATVTLRIYFWVKVTDHGGLKVRSSVIRLTKRAFEEAGISMPDEAREVVFPSGVPVRMLSEAEDGRRPPRRAHPATEQESEAHAAEGQLSSDRVELDEQAKRSRLPEGGQNLLDT